MHIALAMAAPAPVLAAFTATPAPYQLDQAAILRWLAEAHAEAEQLAPAARAAYVERMRRVIERCACGPAAIASRGASFDLSGAWEGHVLFDLARDRHGAGSATRTRLYAERVDGYFARAFAGDREPPDDLVHVTCTGYVSPSGAQKLVAARRWPTRVTHAYQMGCYAAVPALRIAANAAVAGSRRVEIVHTELCSLHLDPSDHGLEQLVVQSLFADGLIRYALVPDDGRPGLRVRALHEEVLPDSADAMSWRVADHGMHMTLSRDVPERIAGALRGFVLELLHRADLPLAVLARTAVAVHPGGPRIIDRVRDVLELAEGQVATSRAVLRDHGNMSSATLPFIWMRMLADPEIPRGTIIPSLAFGPGLTVCGAVLEKQ